MLILTRRTGASLMIGDSVVVTVFEVKGNQVRIGIDAPKNVTIYREEIFKQIQEENKAAASSAGDINLEGAGAFFAGDSGKKKPFSSLSAAKVPNIEIIKKPKRDTES